MYERSEDKISESKIDKTTDKEKEFFGKRIVNFLKKNVIIDARIS